MSAEEPGYDQAAVIAQADARRAANDARLAELGVDGSPEGVRASLLEVERVRRAARAERAGRLDVGGR